MEKNVTAHSATPAQKEEKVYSVFQNIASGYDKMNDVISFGAHRSWKAQLIKLVTVARYEKILDVASGTGDIALWLAQKNPQASIVASDFSENMLAVTERRCGELGIDNVEISCQNAMAMSFEDDSFDCVVVSFGLRNMADYGDAVSEMIRVLRPGGQFYCLDSSYPTNPLVKPFFKLYFKYLMPALGRLFVSAPDEYKWLNDSTEAFLSKDELVEVMRSAGLKDVSYHSHMFGGAARHSGKK